MTRVSTFEVLTANDKTHANITMNTDDGIKLFFGDECANMMEIGITTTRTTMRAISSRTRLSTNVEIFGWLGVSELLAAVYRFLC